MANLDDAMNVKTYLLCLFLFLNISALATQQQKLEYLDISKWLKDYSGVFVALGTFALAIATFLLLLQNRKQIKYIISEHNLKNIMEHIYAEIDQNLNIHEQIFNKFKSLYNIESFEDLPPSLKRTFYHERIDIAPFDATIWDGVKLKISIRDLNKLPIDYSPEIIKKIFNKDYPFNIGMYDIENPPNFENFYHRLKATYSRIKIQNEFVYRLRYATSAHPDDQKAKLKNYFSLENFKELLHDLVRAKSYLTQSLKILK